MIILGLNAYHADALAAIVVDGKLVAAVEEERFLSTSRRIWRGLFQKQESVRRQARGVRG